MLHERKFPRAEDVARYAAALPFILRRFHFCIHPYALYIFMSLSIFNAVSSPHSGTLLRHLRRSTKAMGAGKILVPRYLSLRLLLVCRRGRYERIKDCCHWRKIHRENNSIKRVKKMKKKRNILLTRQDRKSVV